MGDTPRYPEVLGSGIGRLRREDVPHVVRTLLQECREREVERKIRPEIIVGYYTIERQYVASDE